MKICSKCKEEKNFDEFHHDKLSRDGYRSICKLCTKEYHIKNRNKLNLNRKNHHLKENYGITLEEKNLMINNQNNLCKCCGENLGINTYNINVDHDHSTGKVRGILCNGCNIGLGGFKDNIEKLKKAIKYLKEIK